jgi:hypothetical protein
MEVVFTIKYNIVNILGKKILIKKIVGADQSFDF